MTAPMKQMSHVGAIRTLFSCFWNSRAIVTAKKITYPATLLEGFESRLFLGPSAFFDGLSAMLHFGVRGKLEGKEDAPYGADNDQREAGFHRIGQFNDCNGYSHWR